MIVNGSPYIPLNDVPNLPCFQMIRSCRKLSYATIRRWTLRGRKESRGGRVILKSCRIGSLVVTTQEWLDEFFAATGQPEIIGATPSTFTHSSRIRAERARNRLKHHGM